MHRILQVGLGLLIVGMGGQRACSSLPVSEPPRPTVAEPLWNEPALREHLRFFNGPDVAGRATGSIGYATAAAYAATRMAEFGLQPVHRSSFQIMYSVPLVEPLSALVTPVGGDTLSIYPGVDYIPDGRSDSGHVALRDVLLTTQRQARDQVPVPGVMLPHRLATTARLQALRAGGAQVVLSVGPLTPQRATQPVAGLVIMQITPRAAARLLRMPVPQMNRRLNQAEASILMLPQPIRFGVDAQVIPRAEGINTMGYVAGKHPGRSDELIIVCSDLDNLGLFAGVPTLDAAHLGIGTAALLEVARLYAFVSRYTTTPERTVLFAVFSGARQGYLGLQEYLQHPLWPLDKTRSVLYLGLDPGDEERVRALLATHQVPLHVIAPPSDSLKQEAALLLPDMPSSQTGRSESREPMRMSALLTAGVAHARAMAEHAHHVLLRETIGPVRLSTRRDSLRLSSEGDHRRR